MNRVQRKSKEKLVNPTFFVFCEGESEEAYISFLRSSYRIPINIKAKIAGNRITKKYIENYKQTQTAHLKDKTFLIYDGDVPEIVDKLKKIKKVNLLVSNPCFELWYLLHCQNQTAELSSIECFNKLSNHVPNYSKGYFDKNLETQIIKNKNNAIKRAKNLIEFTNPSTNVYNFVEELEKNK